MMQIIENNIIKMLKKKKMKFIIVSILILSNTTIFANADVNLQQTNNEPNTTAATAVSMDNDSAFITSYGANIGLNDNSAAINEAVLNNDNVMIPEGSFKIQSSIKLRNGIILEGTRGTSKIIIDDTFKKGQYFPNSEFAILNEHFSQKYNETTADDITIKGITFVMTKNSVNSIETILGLGNIKHLILEDCDFICKGNGISSNDIDLYAACKNVTIRNCNIKNITNANAGCNIQVRNFTIPSSAKDEENETCNVVIENNSLEKSSNDEAIAVYSVVGQVRNVNIRNNEIYSHGTKHTVVTAIYAGEFNKYSTAKIKDVTFEDNKINVEDFGASIIQVGQSSDQITTIDNVNVKNNVIKAKVSATGVSSVVKVIDQPQNTNVNIEGNDISNIGKIKINYGITGANRVDNNTIEGDFSSSISSCNEVDGNEICNNILGAAIENSTTVENNEMDDCYIGIKCYTSENYSIKNNKINLADKVNSNGIQLLNLSGANPIVFAESNIINTINQSSLAFYRGAGKLQVANNQKNGIGQFCYGSIEKAANDKIDESGTDTKYSGRISNWNIEDSLPIGHITVDTKEMGYAWKKISLGHGVDKWQKIKIS